MHPYNAGTEQGGWIVGAWVRASVHTAHIPGETNTPPRMNVTETMASVLDKTGRERKNVKRRVYGQVSMRYFHSHHSVACACVPYRPFRHVFEKFGSEISPRGRCYLITRVIR